ncbi:2'-5' RNA ligase family protein [Sphingomonas oryzagri]
MPAAPDTRLYLFAMLPDGVGDHIAISNDVEPALPGLKLVSTARRHITLANLSAVDVPEDFRIQLAQWVMATVPPFAFHVVFDQIVAGGRSTLLTASQPLLGALEAQTHVLDMLRQYGLELPAKAAPTPHVTIGYGYREGREGPGVQSIDGISWLADELVLVRSWRGRTWHEELGRWQLPARQRAAA